ncbi:MAG TPA: PEP-CTERM sorting domain-containing protein [Pyrinomonadaceae bacterium]
MRIVTTNTAKLHKILGLLATLMLIGLAQQTASADPLVFSNVTAFQNNDTVQVNLYSNAGITLLGSNLTFSVDISGVLAPGAVDTLRITYTELGGLPVVHDFQIPLFGSVQPPFTLLFSFVSPGTVPQGIPATLTIDLLNSTPDFVIPGGPNQGQTVNSYTYSFNVRPVPEPATLLAMASGLAALGFRVRRRN